MRRIEVQPLARIVAIGQIVRDAAHVPAQPPVEPTAQTQRRAGGGQKAQRGRLNLPLLPTTTLLKPQRRA